MSLKSISLDAFRGATKEVEITFDPSKNITMIFGENGTGKSTVIDSLTFLCDQSRGSLEDRSGAKEHRYLVSAGRKENELKVSLNYADSSWEAKLNGKNIIVSPSSKPPILKTLRRSQISDIVESEPKKKYERIKEFIETPGIEKSEENLRTAIKNIKRAQENSTNSLSSADSQLQELWSKEEQNSQDISDRHIKWAEEIIKQNMELLQNENEAIEEFKTLKDNFASHVANLQDLIVRKREAEKNYETALLKQQEEEKRAIGSSTELLKTLEAAHTYLEQTKEVNSCPVCGQSITKSSLEEDINTKIVGLKSLSDAISDCARKQSSLNNAVKFFEDKRSKTLSSLDEINSFLNAKKLPLQFSCSVPNEIEKRAKDKTDTDDQLSALKDLNLIFVTSWEAMKLHADRNRKTIALKNTVEIQLTKIKETQENIKTSEVLSNHLEKVLECVEGERKRFVEEVLKEISKEVCDLYAKIHPGENISSIELFLHEKRRGSLLIESSFGNQKNIPPQAYFSESHLDTLGICVWLALTKKFAPPDALVVLDDVLTSVDSAHLDRFINMLDEESSNFAHVIITTHYRPWRERYRYHKAAGNKIHFIELKEWHPECGILPDTSKPALDHLKECLKPKVFDRDVVAPKAGVFLENILDSLVLRYALLVPRKASQDYMLGELLAALNKKKRSLLKVEHLDDAGNVIETIELAPILDALDEFVWIRNQVGCHFSVKGQDVSNTDVRSFAEKVVELGDAMVCKAGGDFPKSDKSGSYYESKRKQCRLHPLKMN